MRTYLADIAVGISHSSAEILGGSLDLRGWVCNLLLDLGFCEAVKLEGLAEISKTGP